MFISFVIIYELFSNIQPIYAESLFNVNVKSKYEFGPYTYASVSHQIEIIPQTSQYAPTQYTLNTNESGILDAIVEKGGKSEAVEFNNNSILVNFSEDDIVNKIYSSFLIKYKTERVMTKEGLIRSIIIPLLKSTDEVTVVNQTVQATYPLNWGNQYISSVLPTSSNQMGDNEIIDFSNDQNLLSDIQISIGNRQIYDIELTFRLVNNTDQYQDKTIIIPPNLTPFQETYIDSIKPVPKDIEIDSDQNIIGTYQLKANSEMIVTYKGKVIISIDNNISLDNNETTPFVIADKYWEINNPTIIELSTQYQSISEIYEFVTNKLTYSNERTNTSTITRMGAFMAYLNPDQAVCMEYMDLMISLLRANNIPAKEVDGITYINNDLNDRLHTWVLYYDEEKNQWKNTDPTWGSTTGKDYLNSFDYKHIILAVKGISSQSPDITSRFNDPDNQMNNIKVSYSNSENVNLPTFNQWLADYQYQQLPWYTKLWIWIQNLFKRFFSK